MTGPCKIEGCPGTMAGGARGMCSKHYQRWRIGGDPMKTPKGGAPFMKKLTDDVEYELDLLEAAKAGPCCACGVLLPCNPSTCPSRKRAADYARSGLSTSGL